MSRVRVFIPREGMGRKVQRLVFKTPHVQHRNHPARDSRGRKMNNPLQEVRAALAVVFSSKKYFWLAIISGTVSMAFFVFASVYSVPGNTLDFYVQIFPWYGYLLLASFGFGFALLIPLQVYLFRNAPRMSKASSAGLLFSNILTGVYTTAACAACVSTLFAFAGFGGVLFLTQYREPLIAVSVLALVASIYYSSKKVNDHCESCKIVEKKK